MKKVRFQSPVTASKILKMDNHECHSPRPFIIDRPTYTVPQYETIKTLPYSPDPVQRYENSNASPFPTVGKTYLDQTERCIWSPCNDLELSMLDSSLYKPRRPSVLRPVLKNTDHLRNVTIGNKYTKPQETNVLSSIENTNMNSPPNILNGDNDFFIRRDNISKPYIDINPLQNQLHSLSFGKENKVLSKKADLMLQPCLQQNEPFKNTAFSKPTPIVADGHCRCHHCVKVVPPTVNAFPSNGEWQNVQSNIEDCRHKNKSCQFVAPSQIKNSSPCEQCAPPIQPSCTCHSNNNKPTQNAIDKKTWAIEKMHNRTEQCMEVEKQMNISKDKREPTVADLFKIIKLQNEQLQLLQEKVDGFISSQNDKTKNVQSIQNYSTEHVDIESVNSEQHKISIGVMTSFEVVRTSIINKEIMKQTSENAQIQCNRSQISIKEVIKSQPVNFLEGITPVDKGLQSENPKTNDSIIQHKEIACNEKTLNELSLFNVHIENATTPLMSPDQTMYLDVRDYSDSESGSDDQSNVGWTYYNKVMTHVNGVLQDSDMPSSASALYRNTRRQCVQMQMDKTNVSVSKRVKFGDDPLGIQQPHIYAISSDTSLKMNQLAAKYLKNSSIPQRIQPPQITRPHTVPVDMSFATKNYMERHKLLQGGPGFPIPAQSTQIGEMPRFLDITALKQQSKLL